MEGTQSHLNFLPEKQTDFIFTIIYYGLEYYFNNTLHVNLCLISLHVLYKLQQIHLLLQKNQYDLLNHKITTDLTKKVYITNSLQISKKNIIINKS